MVARPATAQVCIMWFLTGPPFFTLDPGGQCGGVNGIHSHGRFHFFGYALKFEHEGRLLWRPVGGTVNLVNSNGDIVSLYQGGCGSPQLTTNCVSHIPTRGREFGGIGFP